MFKTSIAYDIRRIFQDYRAPQRHLVVSERSIEDDQGMPFSMDSERSTEDHSSAPSPLSSPAAVVQRPAPPVAAKPTPPTPQPVAAAQPPTVPPTVPPVPAKPEAPPAAAAPAASRPGPPQTTTVPPITLPPAVSEAESEDSSTYDKQSESGLYFVALAVSIALNSHSFLAFPQSSRRVPRRNRALAGSSS